MDYPFNHDPKGGKGDMPLASDAASKAEHRNLAIAEKET